MLNILNKHSEEKLLNISQEYHDRLIHWEKGNRYLNIISELYRRTFRTKLLYKTKAYNIQNNRNAIHSIITADHYEITQIVNNILEYGIADQNRSNYNVKSLWKTFRRDENSPLQFLLSSLDLKSCPYCNTQYTLAYYINDVSKKYYAKLEVDHFIPKSKFPLFAFSFYNLIPSCAACNRAKSSVIRQRSYPYYIEFEREQYFILDRIISVRNLIKGNTVKNIICVKDKNLEIEGLYNQLVNEIVHFEYASEYYSEKYLNLLKSISPAISDNDIISRVFGFSPFRQFEPDKPLNKFKSDIAYQLNLVSKEVYNKKF